MISIHFIILMIVPVILRQFMALQSKTPFMWSLETLGVSFLVAFAGIGIWLPWGALFAQQLPTDINTLIPLLFFWISSMASIPIMIKISKKFSFWKRILYVYLVSVFIGGFGITYFTNFWS